MSLTISNYYLKPLCGSPGLQLLSCSQHFLQQQQQQHLLAAWQAGQQLWSQGCQHRWGCDAAAVPTGLGTPLTLQQRTLCTCLCFSSRGFKRPLEDFLIVAIKMRSLPGHHNFLPESQPSNSSSLNVKISLLDRQASRLSTMQKKPLGFVHALSHTTHIFVNRFSRMSPGGIMPAIPCHLEEFRLSWKSVSTSSCILTVQNGSQISFGTPDREIRLES